MTFLVFVIIFRLFYFGEQCLSVVSENQELGSLRFGANRVEAYFIGCIAPSRKCK